VWQAKHACPHHSCDCVERGMVPTGCTIQQRQAVAVRLKGPHDRVHMTGSAVRGHNAAVDSLRYCGSPMPTARY
jgi:hypothetical protein